MKRLMPIGVAVTVMWLLSVTVALAQEKPSGTAALEYVTYLASEDLEGRDTGTPGYEKSVEYVAGLYEKWGLEPAGDNDSYIQEFPFPFHKHQFDYPVLAVDDRHYYYDDGDFNVPRYTGGGKVEAEVVFVGYGISAAERGLDEYADVDVTGKIVLVMRGVPGDDTDCWKGMDTDSAKVAMAVAHGAAGMLLCTDFSEEDRSLGWWRLAPGNYKEGFIVYGVDERVVNRLLVNEDESRRAFISRLQTGQRKLDTELVSMSSPTGKKARMEVKVEFDPQRIGKNVLGMIRGTDPRVKNEVIVLGGHLDHLGIRYGKVYNGADDNASGSAVVMEVGRVMMRNKVMPRRTILFACWGGEERGLLGSRYWAAHPTLSSIDKTALNFNMDMVGLGQKMAFGGVYFAPNIWQLIQKNSEEETLAFLEPGRGGPGGSDHTPFITRGIPAFMLIGRPFDTHPDYHMPGDDVEKISMDLLEKTTQFIYDNALLLANYEGDLLVENRLPLYIHKSAIVVNLHPLCYKTGLSALDSLEDEWVDIQLVTVRPDVTKEPAQRMAELVTLLDEATGVKSDFSKSDNASMAFSSRRENLLSMAGLQGAESVGSDISHLRIAAKMGATYVVLDGADGTWISPESGLTEAGQKAVEAMNAQKMLILLQNQSQDVMTKILDASTHPVIVTGVTDVLALSDDFLKKIDEKGGLLTLPVSPDSDAENVVEQMEAIQERIDLKHLVLYPQAGSDLRIDKLHEMLKMTIALHEKGVEEEAIMGLLGGNLESAFKKIFQIKPPRMRF